MKKASTRILAIFITLLMVVALFPIGTSAAATPTQHKITLATTESDYLTGLTPTITGNTKDQGHNPIASTDASFTNEVFAADPGYATSAVNSRYWATNATYASADPAVVFDGVEKTYYYSISFSTGNIQQATKFALYAGASDTSSDLDKLLDGSFDILYSSDGGKTYSIAWSSKSTNSNKTTANGGDWTEVSVAETSQQVAYKYRYIQVTFDAPLKNVTHIVYAASQHRSSTTYKCAAITEFDLYGPKLKEYKITNPTGTLDLLNGLKPYIHGHMGSSATADTANYAQTSSTKLTDGIYATEQSGSAATANISYINTTWANSQTISETAVNNPKVKFNGIDQSYCYAFEFKPISAATATGFALYTNSNTPSSESGTFGDGNCDKYFQILVSTDGGSTYSVVWSSKSDKGNKNTANGGDWTEKTIKDGSTFMAKYREIAVTFEEPIENVTNFVYAVITPKAMTGAGSRYTSRLSEIDLYGTLKSYTVEHEGKADVLDGKIPYLYKGDGSKAQSSSASAGPQLTDGCYAKGFITSSSNNGGSLCYAYANATWCSNGQQSGYIANPKVTFAGVDRKFATAWEFTDLGGVNISDFALYYSIETTTASTSALTPSNHQDKEFSILVSTDGGETYTEAWISARVTAENANGASALIANGGNWSPAVNIVENGVYINKYCKLTGTFDEEITGVTNIVYATNNPRAFYYGSRISEFDVYEKLSNFPEETAISHSATITDNFAFNYYVSIGDGSTLDNYQDLAVEYTITDIFGETKNGSIDYNGIMTEGARLTFTINGIAAKNLADTIEVVFTAKNADGQEFFIKDTYSIKDYLVNLVKGDYENAVKTVAVDALKYGAAAQKYFAKKYNETDLTADQLMTAALTDEQLAMGTNDNVLTDEIPDASFDDDAYKDGTAFVAKSVVFNDSLELKFYLTSTYGAEDLTVKYRYSYVEEEITSENGLEDVDGMLFFKIPIRLFDAGQTVKVSVYNESETTCKSLNYSINTYIKNRLAASTDDSFKALLQATLNLAESAKALYEANEPV